VLYGIACGYAIPEQDRALDGSAGEWAEKDPDLTSLRGLPRFQQLTGHAGR
jgi:hypothetical protein